MKLPSELTNDELALHIEFWASLNEELTDMQRKFFDEAVWRLRLTTDKEKSKNE